MRKISVILGVLAVVMLVGMVSACPTGCPVSNSGTKDGYSDIIFSHSGDLKVTYVSKSAAYTNTFGYVSSGVRTALGVSNDAVAGTTYDIGQCTADSKVVVYLKSGESPARTYYSDGAGPDDNDCYDHAKVTKIDDNTYKIEFEDVWKNADWDYNDVVLSVSCTPIQTQHPVPEFPTLALPVTLIIGMLGAVFYIRETRQH